MVVYWGLIILIGLLTWYWFTQRKAPVIKEIIYYPVKSCAGVSTLEAKVTDTGLMFDRWWAVLNLSNDIITQKREPRLGRVKPHLSFDSDGNPSKLTLTYPGFPPCEISAKEPDVTELISCTFFQSECFVYEQSPKAREWFKLVMQTEYLLVRQASYRKAIEAKPDKAALLESNEVLTLADQLQFLVATEASYNQLLRELPEAKAIDISMDSFRPNIILKNTQPFAEDKWEAFSINGVRFKVVDRCERCPVTTISPKTLEFDRYREPVKTLARINGDGKMGYFGIVANRQSNGTIAVGNRLKL